MLHKEAHPPGLSRQDTLNFFACVGVGTLVWGRWVVSGGIGYKMSIRREVGAGYQGRVAGL